MRSLPWIPVVIIAVMLVMALFAPLLAPYSPTDQTLRDKLLPPFRLEGGSTKYLLGTDALRPRHPEPARSTARASA